MPTATKATKATAKKGRRTKTKGAEPKSRGLAASRLASASAPSKVESLTKLIEEDRGSIIGIYKDPLGGNWQIVAALPIDAVQPTPFQRDLSEAHVGRLAKAIDKLNRFLDPVIVVRTDKGVYWTPNGHHRTAAMRHLGSRSIVAMVVPEAEMAYQILALNTEKAHNLRERALEVIRMAQALADLDPRPEREFETEFEEPALLTLGLCYQQKGRFAGSAYHPVLKRIEKFLGSKLPAALETRRDRATRVIELEEAVNDAVAKLKKRGFESPYLKNFVVARINPLRFQRGKKAEFDETIDKMLRAASRFDASKVKTDQLARASGPVGE